MSANQTAWGEEQDIVVTDSLVSCPHMFGNSIHPIEAVVGVIQVKSDAKSGEIRSAVRNVSSVLERHHDTVLSNEARDQRDAGVPALLPFAGIFCYKSRDSEKAVVANFLDECSKLPSRELWPQSLCVLGQFSTQWTTDAERPLLPADWVAPRDYGRLWSFRDQSKVGNQTVEGLALYLF